MELEVELMMLLKVLVAMTLGGLVGLERELAGKPAGLRTNMLVAGAASLMVMLGESLVGRFQETQLDNLIQADPIRILEAIIVGISFIGAGTIIQREREDRVENLTTAAIILFTAAIAVAVAIDRYALAVGLTVVDLLVAFALARLVSRTSWGKRHDV